MILLCKVPMLEKSRQNGNLNVCKRYEYAHKKNQFRTL